MKEKPIKAKEKAFEYLNNYKKSIQDKGSREIILTLMMETNRSYESCRVYYYDWKEKELGCPRVKRDTKKIKYKKPQLEKYGDILVGENGEYSLEDGGLLLTNGKAYWSFESKEDVIKSFDEILAAYDILQGMEI